MTRHVTRVADRKKAKRAVSTARTAPSEVIFEQEAATPSTGLTPGRATNFLKVARPLAGMAASSKEFPMTLADVRSIGMIPVEAGQLLVRSPSGRNCRKYRNE